MYRRASAIFCSFHRGVCLSVFDQFLSCSLYSQRRRVAAARIFNPGIKELEHIFLFVIKLWKNLIQTEQQQKKSFCGIIIAARRKCDHSRVSNECLRKRESSQRNRSSSQHVYISYFITYTVAFAIAQAEYFPMALLSLVISFACVCVAANHRWACIRHTHSDTIGVDARSDGDRETDREREKYIILLSSLANSGGGRCFPISRGYFIRISQSGRTLSRVVQQRKFTSTKRER